VGNRYGRNQKRAHREEIERLNKELSELEFRAYRAERTASDAVSKAYQDFVRNGEYVDYATKEICRELARSYAPALREAAEKVLSSRRNSPPIRFDAYSSPAIGMMTSTVIRGEIPALRYNIQVMT